jgi:hypothetical protein
VLLLPTGTLQITGLPSVTYDAMVTTGAAGPAAGPMNANIGRVLVQQLLKERPETVVPEGITALLEEVRVEKAKKVRKAKAVKA